MALVVVLGVAGLGYGGWWWWTQHRGAASPRMNASAPGPPAVPAGAGSTPADLASPPAAAPGLAPGDWGTAPNDPTDKAEQWPALPHGAGWASFQRHGALEPVVAGAGIVVLASLDSEHLTALDLTTGQPRWEADVPGFRHWVGPPCYVNQQAVFVPTEVASLVGLAALDVASGKLRWSLDGLRLLSAGDAGAWVTIATADNLLNHGSRPVVGADLELLDSATGQIVQTLKLGPLYGYSAQTPSSGQSMAVVTASELVLAHSDGTVERTPRAHPDWFALLCLDDAGVLEASCGPASAAESNRYTDRVLRADPPQRAALHQRLTQEGGTGRPAGLVDVRLYTRPGLQAQWHTAWTDWLLAQNGHANLQLGSAAVVVCGESTADVQTIDRASGQRRTLYSFAGTDYNGAFPLGGRVVLRLRDEQGQTPGTAALTPLLLDPLTGLTSPALPGQAGWPPAAYTAGRLCYQAATSPQFAQGRLEPPSTALVSLAAGPDLTPQPGELKLLGGPEPYTQLVRMFYASAAPLTDDTLMRQAVAAGQRGLGQLLARAETAQPAQLDALARLAAYLEQAQLAAWPDSGDGSGAPTLGWPHAPLFAALRRLGAAVVPAAARWLDDPQLALYQFELTGLLVEQGTPEALAAVRRKYALPRPAAFTPPAAPFKVDREQPAAAAGQPPAPRQWSEAAGPKGARYCAFTADWLGGAADVYLGLDANGDGAFEQVLPTGLTALDSALLATDGVELPANLAALSLSLTLQHGTLALGRLWRSVKYDATSGFSEPGPPRYGTQRLELAALRLDTDGDTLSDSLERFLFNDTEGSDSDDDGLKDAVDPTPNVDETKLGPLERGVARALAAYFSDPANAPPPAATAPYRAVFLVVNGCRPVAVALPQSYCICVTDPAQQSVVLARDHATPVRVVVYAPEPLAPGASAPADRSWTVSISQGYSGWSLELRKFGGELYPVGRTIYAID